MGEKRLDNALNTYMFANDPRFLFTRLRKDSYVSHLADRMEPDALVKWVNRHGEKTPTNVECIVELYAHLVALALHDRSTVLRAIKKLKLPSEQWMPAILAYIEESLPPTSYTRIVCSDMRSAPAVNFAAANYQSNIEPLKADKVAPCRK